MEQELVARLQAAGSVCCLVSFCHSSYERRPRKIPGTHARLLHALLPGQDPWAEGLWTALAELQSPVMPSDDEGDVRYEASSGISFRDS